MPPKTSSQASSSSGSTRYELGLRERFSKDVGKGDDGFDDLPTNDPRRHLRPVADCIAELKEHNRVLSEPDMVAMQLKNHDGMIGLYVNDIWLGEWDGPKNGGDSVALLALVQDGSEECRREFDENLGKVGVTTDATKVKLWSTLRNLSKVVPEFFPTDHTKRPDAFPPFSVELARSLHKRATKDILQDDTSGVFRKKDVQALGYNTVYAPHREVKVRIETLFKLVNELRQTASSLEEHLKLAAGFIVEFLHIHPFIDGNGRVARLLVSDLLRFTTIVPISLYLETGRRELYCKALCESQRRRNHTNFYIYLVNCAMMQGENMKSYLGA